MQSNKKLVVIGGGAAGFFTAINAATFYPWLQVTIVEKTSKLLSKVKVSGGGRCNVTHACFENTALIKNYPRGSFFLKNLFPQFNTTDTIQWFEKKGIRLKTETDGRMFPESNTSQTIIDCFLNEVNRLKIEVQMNAEVKALNVSASTSPDERKFTIEFQNKKTLTADFICVACGGFSKVNYFDWLVQTGHSFEMPVPSLFTFNMPKHPITALMGISVPEVKVKIAGTKLVQTGPLLITHWGLSGPVILKLSAWAARDLALANYSFTLIINWLPNYHEKSLNEKMQQLRFEIAAQKIYNRNPFNLPARLWEYFLHECGIAENIRWADLPSKEQNKLIKILCVQECMVSGKTTFKEEFVTAGGIQLNEINPSAMESKIVKGLFFAGEILNIDGITGGFNFQNAWTTGWIAAKGMGIKHT